MAQLVIRIVAKSLQNINQTYRRRPLKQAGIFIALGGAIVIFVLLPIAFNGAGYNSRYFGAFPIAACQGFGYFGGEKWTFVGIDIRIGQMSFGLAKAADLAFNWGAGRGLQILLAWLSYRVFTDALLRTTEVAYVPYDLFTSLALYSTKTDALWQLSKGLYGMPGWRVKAIIGWLLFSTAYLAAFPSLIDAMSGYEASMTTSIILPNTTLMVVSDDAWVDLSPIMFNNCTNKSTTSYTSSYECMQFYDQKLQQSYDAWRLNDNNQFYTENPVNIVCRADQHLYHWGFSAEWVLVVACVNSFWLFGLWILWLDADTQSQFCKKGRRMGIYRAIADIAEVMREDLGPNLCAYSEAELTAAVRKQRPIKYYVSDGDANGVAHIGLSSRPSGKVKLSWDQEYGCHQE